jgi:hypothetical protein
MRALALFLVPVPALAHEGHGTSGMHLHPGEWMGLIALAAVVVFAFARFWKR